ncbi:MAG: hypothetical protein A2Z88_06225 [Omnitrophica WOR_2 bacterium GWA2_47_8]|nr:MAG: hypothetical protein A2Z88_06225 [Omnitrophica WOR_2 bacterium GWA2_47_8]
MSPLPTKVDQKMRWGGLLENPWLSRIQRNLLDAGKVSGFFRIIKDINCGRILDVGCGLGEYARADTGEYVGLDNSLARVSFAAKHNSKFPFLIGNAFELPFKNKSFDTIFFIDTSHHLTDEEFVRALEEFKRLSRRYIFVSDPVFFGSQNSLSRFFYRLDRGGRFRTIDEMQAVFHKVKGLDVASVESFKTYLKLYQHTTFILTVDGNSGKI